MSQHDAPPPVQPGAIATPPTSILAISSLVLGIIGLCTGGLGGIIGLVLGLVALMRIKSSDGRLGGGGVAIAGVSVSAVAIIVGCLSIGIFLPALGQARIEAKNIKAQAQLRSLANAINVYALENQDMLPPPDGWLDALADEDLIEPDLMVAYPGAEADGRIFAMNAALAGRTLESITDPFSTVLVFEVAPGSPLAGGPELLAPEPFHPDGYIIGFVDGHIEQYDGTMVPMLVWEPEQ